MDCTIATSLEFCNMDYNDLSLETIERALSYLDCDSREEWLMAGMALKHELGHGGFNTWTSWASASSSFNIKNSRSQWKGFGRRKNDVKIGSLIHVAMNYGFKFESNKPISHAVKKQRQEARMIAEREAIADAEKAKQQELKSKQTALQRWNNAVDAMSHPYLDKKNILSHGTKIGEWVWKNDNNELVKEPNALLIPLSKDGNIVSLQAIFPYKVEKNGNQTDKFLLYGAEKEGVHFVFYGFDTETILLCEGWATGATLFEATQKTVYVCIDSGNLVHVAKIVREKYPMSHIIVCADNDQYKKVNTGLKSADKVACEVDADIVYPTFKNTKNKPTDFNDLMLENLGSYDEILSIVDVPRQYKPKDSQIEEFNAFDLMWVNDAEKKFKTSQSPLEVACAGLAYGIQLASDYPAFITMDAIRCRLKHPLIHHKTHTSIMCRIHWSIQARKRIALTAIKPSSWGNKHNHIVVSDLSEYKQQTPVSLIFAPMASGKTKNVIKPFCESSTAPFCAVAHRRSLVSDLASRLHIESYENVNFSNADLEEKVAVCLPSTQARNLLPFMSRVVNLAIDEISQNIRFTSSKECKVTGANQEKVFLGFKELINECENVIAADASIDQTTIDFFEDARPDEVFTIVEQVPKNEGKKCFLYGDRADLLTQVEVELNNNGKVWFSVESAERAEVLAQIYKDYKVITITSKNSKTKKIQQFLNNIEKESLNYDMVIASPAISSGVSVEHKGCEHFTMIAGMASGHSICFSDFAQMLGRVRYVKSYHVCLQKNNKRFEGVTELSILTGLRQAQAIEGGSLRDNEYSRFNAHIQAKEEVYRADFANGFVWFLQYYCFEILVGRVPLPNYMLSEMMKDLTKEAKEENTRKIVSATKISKQEAEILDSKREITNAEYYDLLAFKLRMSLNIELDDDIHNFDVEMFENMSRLDRFARYLGLQSKHDDSELNISLRKFQKAQIEATKILFGDIDLSKHFFDTATCDSIIKTASSNENRFMMSALRLIPSKYGQWKENKRGELLELKMPERSGKSVAQILEKFGLGWKRTTQSVNGVPISGYVVKEDDYLKMKFYAERRYKGLVI